MNARSSLVLSLGLLLSAPAAHTAGTDVLVLRNGDRITGEIKKLVGGRLEFKTDKAGTLKVKWDGVAGLTSTRYFEVLLDDARRRYGSLLPPSGVGSLRVGSDTKAEDVDLEQVAQIDRLRPAFWSRIKGSIDLGLSYTKADNKTEWNLDAQASYRTSRRKLSFALDSTLRRSDAGDFDREDLSGQYERFLTGRWLASAFGNLQRNSELALDSRLLAGAGAGLHLVRNVENDLAVLAGFDFASEEFTDERAGSESIEAIFAITYNLYALGGHEFAVTANAALFPSLSVSGRVRFEGRLSVRKELFKDFYVNLQFFDSLDNQAGDSGSSQNDLGLTTSLGWSF